MLENMERNGYILTHLSHLISEIIIYFEIVASEAVHAMSHNFTVP
jgi:hypothetical protein